jgi:ankyrin repeat protein
MKNKLKFLKIVSSSIDGGWQTNFTSSNNTDYIDEITDWNPMAAVVISPYSILEVDEKSNDLDLRIAFRKKVKQYNEDRLNGSANPQINDEQYRKISRAYETLSDYDKRKLYDKQKEWTSELDVSKYTLQQLAAEHCYASQLKRRLLKAKLQQIDGQDPITGQTPLYCAARAGNVEAVEYLIEQGADPDLKQRTGSTALHAGSFFGHPDIVRCLLESGANYTLTNSSKNQPEVESFTSTVRAIFTEMQRAPFVQAAANQLGWFKDNISNIEQHIDTQYHVQRQTLLHCACRKGHIDLVKWLIEKRNAKIDIVDVNLNSALHLAAYGGHTSIVEYLLNHCADSTLMNKWGMTAEQEGLRHGNKITSLFQSMRELNMFEMAVKGGDWWFKYHFGDNSSNTVDGNGTSILYVACRFGQTSVAKWLLEHGADINCQLPGQLSTPLHGAVYHGHISTVELLLSRNANINIRNKYAATPSDDCSIDEIRTLLNQHRKHSSSDKYIAVHLYGDGATSGNGPIAKVQLHCDATIDDLIQAMPASLGNQYQWFSVARSPLNKYTEHKKTSLISAVCRARCVDTKFIDLPICLITYTTPRYMKSGYEMRQEYPIQNTRAFSNMLTKKMKTTSFLLKAESKTNQVFKIDQIRFMFTPNSVETAMSINIQYILEPDAKESNLQRCLCLFKVLYEDGHDKLNDMPIVTVKNKPDVKLYTCIPNSAHWFCLNQPNRLPYIGGIYALIQQVEIIPKQLYLLPDMFIQGALASPLQHVERPVSCQYLKIGDANSKDFPHTAYHGTSITVIQSILMDGLVMANTVVSSGKRVCPPDNHIARGVEAFGILDFANAIFLSPSIHYVSDPAYAVQFPCNDQSMIAVLECRIKEGEFKTFKSTVSAYEAKPGDDINAIEWRLTNPAYIRITGVLFIPVIESIDKAIKSRESKLGMG